jgi:hypothetical protein
LLEQIGLSSYDLRLFGLVDRSHDIEGKALAAADRSASGQRLGDGRKLQKIRPAAKEFGASLPS